MTKSPELKQLIADRIRAEGAITFRDYMAMALYTPGLGYYTRGNNPIGRAGDFYTSPTSTPLFGKMLARWLGERFREMGGDVCTIVEMGAARGVLARDIKAALRDELPAGRNDIDYRQIDYGDALPAVDNACIISNELIDAFPVHRVKMAAGELREIYVDLDGDRFTEITRPPSTARLPAYFNDLDVSLSDGFTTEINLAAIDWVRTITDNLARGYVLTIDYGYESPELYAPYRSGGTLMGYHRHSYSTDPYANIGTQDLTSHVNFSALMKYGDDAGLRTISFATQSDFLSGLGGQEMLAELQKRSISDVAALKDYLAVKGLLMADGMGGVFKVLVQEKTRASADGRTYSE